MQVSKAVVKYNRQCFSVDARKITKVDIELARNYTVISVFYVGSKFPTRAFLVPLSNGDIDYKTISNIYVSIMEANEKLLKEKNK